MTISMEEFLKLINEIVEEEERDSKFSDEYFEEGTSLPSVFEILNKMKDPPKKAVQLSNKSGTIDVENMKNNEILRHVKTKNEFKVGDFIIHVSDGSKVDHVNIHILENQRKTASGFPCNMLVKKNVISDKRFASCPWLSYFSGKYGVPRRTAYDVPTEEIINIIKWVKAINKMTAFL